MRTAWPSHISTRLSAELYVRPLCSPVLTHPLELDILSNPSSRYPMSSVMSGGLPSITTTTTDTSTFNAIFDNALKEYENKTGTNLTTHPLSDKLRTCDSPDAVLNILQEHVRAYEESRNGDQRLTKLLDPTIHILYLFSSALGEGVSLVSSVPTPPQCQ
ncbi:hypothetical protein EDB89DRAFT_1041681 [Lactarius sanguifluus]|nr:hypothetical protein EDB89DRAFT_1041681 [Lactarius sanguifluus]